MSTILVARSEEHTSELQSRSDLVCRLLLEKKKSTRITRRLPPVGPALLRRLRVVARPVHDPARVPTLGDLIPLFSPNVLFCSLPVLQNPHPPAAPPPPPATAPPP